MLSDLRYGLRTIRRTAPLSAAVVVTLAVGVGMTSVVFSLVNGLLFRPAVTRDPRSFVAIYPIVSSVSGVSGTSFREVHGPDWLATREDFDTIRDATRSLAAVTAFRWASFALSGGSGASAGGDTVAMLRGAYVSCNFLSTHVGAMRVGRGLAESDCAAAGGEPVAVISERSWTLYFSRDPAIVGRVVRLNDRPLTIVGVAPDDAAGGPGAMLVYVPYTMQPVLDGPANYFRDPPDRHAWLTLSGRLQPGRSLADAQAELRVIATMLDRRHSERQSSRSPGHTTDILVTDGALIHVPEAGRSTPLLVALCFGATMLIVLMVCANVTTLLLARAVARRHEMAVRVSLGGSRAQLLRQLLAETLILGACAAVPSLILARYLPARIAQSLTDFPLLDTFGPDWRVFSVTFAVAFLASCIAGLFPAVETLRFNVSSALTTTNARGGGGGGGGVGQVSTTLRGTLIANQLSISLALLIVMGLFARAETRLLDVHLDYDPNAVIVANIDLTRAGYTGPAARAFYDRLVPSIESLPGVRAVAISSPAPFAGASRKAFMLDGDARPTRLASVRAVSASYFPIVGVKLVEGQLFSEAMSTPRAAGAAGVKPVVVSASFASTFFRDAASGGARTGAIGRRIRFANDDVAEIVGVVSDTSSIRPSERDEPLIYQPPDAAIVATVAPIVQIDLHADADADAEAAASAEAVDMRVHAVQRAIYTRVQQLDPRLAARPETVAALMTRQASQYAAVLKVIAVPGLLALFLALVGIYGLTAFVAAERMHEIGVRIALGARTADVIGLFLWSLHRPVIASLVGGSLLAMLGILLTRSTNLNLDLASLDPLTYVAAVALLLATAIGATLIPAARAARRDPWSVLRG